MEGGREWQSMHGKIMIQDQRAKAAVIWVMVGRVKSGYIQTCGGDLGNGGKGEEWLYTNIFS